MLTCEKGGTVVFHFSFLNPVEMILLVKSILKQQMTVPEETPLVCLRNSKEASVADGESGWTATGQLMPAPESVCRFQTCLCWRREASGELRARDAHDLTYAEYIHGARWT